MRVMDALELSAAILEAGSTAPLPERLHALLLRIQALLAAGLKAEELSDRLAEFDKLYSALPRRSEAVGVSLRQALSATLSATRSQSSASSESPILSAFSGSSLSLKSKSPSVVSIDLGLDTNSPRTATDSFAYTSTHREVSLSSFCSNTCNSFEVQVWALAASRLLRGGRWAALVEHLHSSHDFFEAYLPLGLVELLEGVCELELGNASMAIDLLKRCVAKISKMHDIAPGACEAWLKMEAHAALMEAEVVQALSHEECSISGPGIQSIAATWKSAELAFGACSSYYDSAGEGYSACTFTSSSTARATLLASTLDGLAPSSSWKAMARMRAMQVRVQTRGWQRLRSLQILHVDAALVVAPTIFQQGALTLEWELLPWAAAPLFAHLAEKWPCNSEASELAATLAVSIFGGSAVPESMKSLEATALDRLASVAHHKGDKDSAGGYAAKASAVREQSIRLCKGQHADSTETVSTSTSALDRSTSVGDVKNTDSFALGFSSHDVSEFSASDAPHYPNEE